MFSFHHMDLALSDGNIRITRMGNLDGLNSDFVQVHLAGEHKDSHLGSKMLVSSEGGRLRYVSHSISGDTLTVIQESPFIRATTVFTAYPDTNAIRIVSNIMNITSQPIIVEEASAFCLTGFGSKSHAENMFLTRFLQSHHSECQPRQDDFAHLGLCGGRSTSQQRVGHCNIGSWSTKEALPMGIVENREKSDFFMFQLESPSSWYYEISDAGDTYYIYLGGASYPFGGWYKELQPGQAYESPAVAFSFGKSANEVVGNMTAYRRHIAGACPADETLPTIFNEYMHLSWDSPSAENTAKIAPIVAKTGVEYYVIDCGWHNEEDGSKVYPYVGHWQESHARFPEGLKKTTDLIRSLGMKPGLWIEPEIIGIACKQMLDYYDDDCFFQRHGKRLSVMNRHFLDYRNPRVRQYMTQAIDNMVEQYGAAYIKCDYNQDCGIGTDRDASSPGEGLELAAQAFLSWIGEMQKRHPEVIFEGCASGGMRLDYKTLSHYSLVSTSDQTDYLLYPYIAGNILAGVLPEQAAVWSYPAASDCTCGEDVSRDRIVINMVNSFLGRMHLASHLDYLSEDQLALIREGVDYYRSLSQIKKTAMPIFPLGFTKFGDPAVCAGFQNGKKIYLAVWNLKDVGSLNIPLGHEIAEAHIAYPSDPSFSLSVAGSNLIADFHASPCAGFMEVTLK